MKSEIQGLLFVVLVALFATFLAAMLPGFNPLLCGDFHVFLAIFLFKHRIELIISFPFLALMFAWYLHMGYKSDSPAQRPEKLYKETAFIVYMLCLSALVILLMLIDIPSLKLFQQ